MRAVITVIGQDKVGIIAKVSNVLADNGVNILDISQTILQDMFTMIMLVDVLKTSTDIKTLVDILDETGKEIGIDIRLQREDLFNAMHRI